MLGILGLELPLETERKALTHLPGSIPSQVARLPCQKLKTLLVSTVNIFAGGLGPVVPC
jgi:hypothetical protein